MGASIDFELMTSSLLMTMLMKLFFFVFAALSIHFLLGWMDARTKGGFASWLESAKASKHENVMVMVGIYYCIRFSALYIWAALLFSS